MITIRCDCGYELKINRKKVIFYLLLGKDKMYTRCNNCQKTYCIRILHHIVRDNADKQLRELGKNDPKIDINWRNP